MRLRRLLAAAGALYASVNFSCSSEESSNEVETGSGPLRTARLSCAGDRARSLLDDGSGSALAEAFSGYTLSELETKVIATWWLFLFAAYDTGVVDPVLLDPGLQAQLAAIFERYPRLFNSCSAPSGSLGKGAQALIDYSKDFSCTGTCIPSAAVIKKTLEAGFDAIRKRAAGPAGKLLNDLYDQATKLSKSLKGVSSTTEALNRDLTLEEAEEISNRVAQELLVGAAGVAFAVAFPEVSATVGLTWSALVAGKGIADELWKAAELRRECLDFQRDECAAGCTCSVEVIQYSAAESTRVCGQWTGPGARPFCTAIPGSTADCCTCDPASRDRLQSCVEDLSFKADATRSDYENCCGDARAIVQAAGQATPSCPCQPPSAAASNLSL